MPQHVRNQRRLRVPAPAPVAFLFFTPKGEELWIDEWRPRYIRPAQGVTQAGMVFTTGEGADFTVWQLLDFDPVGLRSRYARTTPALRAGTVSVQVEALDRSSSAVLVEYDMTALHPEAASSLDAYRDPEFSRMIDGWEAKVRERLPVLMEAFGS